MTLDIKNRIAGKVNVSKPVYISFDAQGAGNSTGSTSNSPVPFFLRELISSYFLNVNIPENVFPCPEDEDKLCKPNVGYVFDPRIDNLMTNIGTPTNKIYDKADNKFGFTSFFLERKVINDLPLFFIRSTNTAEYVFFPTNDTENTIGGKTRQRKFAITFKVDNEEQFIIYSGLPYKVDFYFINDDGTTRKINVNVQSLIPGGGGRRSFEGVFATCKNNFFYITPELILHFKQDEIFFTIYQKNYYYFSNTMTCELTNDFAVPLLQFPERTIKNNNQFFYTTEELCNFACGNKVDLCYFDGRNNDKIIDKKCGTDGCFGLCENVKEMCVLDDGEFICVETKSNKTEFFIFGTIGFIVFIFLLFLLICVLVKK